MKILLTLFLALLAAPGWGEDLPAQFAQPPPSARPWVYWFWNNGNVTKAGITADLEAMKRAGIGGVIIMDVAERFAPPRGTADFMNPEWQELFRFAVSEAKRLGLEVNMTNGPGWCGSSGPWITPELSMQMLVHTNIIVTGPASFSAALPRPPLPNRSRDGFDSTIKAGEFYRDVAVLAIPDATNGFVSRDAVVDLTARLDTTGQLHWQVPPGRWDIERIGHTITGASTRPPVAGGNGLECDKLSRQAMDAQFAGMLGRLIAQSSPNDRKALVATHIDSWEVGSQNWTPKMREEFKKRRGYDPMPFLPDILKTRAIGDSATAARFVWDYQQTIAELLAENYSGRLAELAHQHHMRLTIEGYDLPLGDEATYTARADEPMSEFWTQSSSPVNLRKGRQMASVAHIYGHTIVGAESFTSGDNEKWKLHPAVIKSLGDFEFCQGINRFVIHRYAHQPYLDRAPGATMGPWGLHYERTQTWWELSSAWHEYLARCQLMLRQGKFVADLCYLRPESPMQTYFTPTPNVPDGYKYDECSAEALVARMTVKHGQLTLPDGMSYRVLVVPPVKTMTPELARKIKSLVAGGATVLVNGPRPQTSPSLANYPKCDAGVARLTREIWGECDGNAVTEHHLGPGLVVWGEPVARLLKRLGAPADFQSDVKLNWIHRHGEGMEIYFVANPAAHSVETTCLFRVQGLQPELWNPETGQMEQIAAYQPTAEGLAVPLHFEASGSRFILFRKRPTPVDPVVSFTRDGQAVFVLAKPPSIVIQDATYGVPGDAQRTRDVRGRLQALVEGGTTEFQVADMARGDDPALNVVKTLIVDFTVAGKPERISGQDPDTITLDSQHGAAERAADVWQNEDGQFVIEARQSGRYELTTASGKTLSADIANVAAPVDLNNPWEVNFPAHWGGPAHATMDSLASWSDSVNNAVKYFSGTADYVTHFNWRAGEAGEKGRDQTWLNLGDVQVMARVKLNGCDLGIVWKPPFRVNATRALQPGQNTLEVRVANLWPNRLIGDAALPAKDRVTWSSWEPFIARMPLLKSGLLGPVTIESVAEAIAR